MQEIFEKIIAEITELAEPNGNPYIDCADVIEIVNQVAEEYANLSENLTSSDVPDKNVGEIEEFCEWRNTGISDEWKPSCSPNGTYNVFGVAWFKRCPYCGKRIKVVE